MEEHSTSPAPQFDQTTKPENERFKPFHETYKIITFSMTMGMLYPNPATERTRLLLMLGAFLSITPVTVILLLDLYMSWQRGDFLNIIRHCTIFVPFTVLQVKTIVMYYRRADTKYIIDEINDDHSLYNDLPRDYRSIVEKQIRTDKVREIIWTMTVMAVVMVFPIMAAGSTAYSYIVDPIPQRYMIHDLVIFFLEPEARFETPCFEIMFAYMLYCCYLLSINFIGYDGLFGLSIGHACLNMRLYCKALEDAMNETDTQVIFEKMVEVIKAQCRVFKFVETIQRTFNIWLGVIFMGTLVHCCNCMYQLMEGVGFDVKYIIFIIGSVIHIYLPCLNASKLKTMSVETATLIYSCGWEAVYDERIRKMIAFMIARAQIPITITAFNMLEFDMELFVSIMHTSYSMFTILRS